MYSATHQPTTAPQYLKDLEMGTLSRATSLTSVATKDGATVGDITAAGDSTIAGESTAARESTATEEV